MRQPKWDKFEAALLIEAYWKIKSVPSQRREIVTKLSSCLRARAQFKIDDTFRNENGINMRLGELDYLFSEGTGGLKNTSDLFRMMVVLYRDDREEFEKILSEAKYMLDEPQNVRLQFCTWLQEKTSKPTPEVACQLLKIGEEFCQKIKVLAKPLFETTDTETIKKYVKTVTNNKIFRIKNKRQHPAIVDAANWYYSFICVLPDLNLLPYDEVPFAEKEQQEEVVPKPSDMPAPNEPTKESLSSTLVTSVDRLLRSSNSGISKEDICKQFPDVSTRQINLALADCHAVLVLKKYYHRDNISDYNEMADILLEVISRQFTQNGNYTSAQQLYTEARLKLDDFFFYNNAFDSRQEIYDLAVHLFEQEKYKNNSFLFLNNMHIWKEEPDYPKDYHGLLIKYARDHGNVFTRENAVSYFELIGSSSPSATFSFVIFNTGKNSFLQYAENCFVLAEALNINDYILSSLNSQIENLLEDEDYVAVGEIDDYFFSTLPSLPCSIPWSALLLEDVLRLYETDYMAIEAGKDNDKKTLPAAIVRKKSQYRCFSDLVWNEVYKSFPLPKEFTASEFREFLLEKGFIRGTEKMWSVHKTVADDIRFYWTDNNGRVTIN